MHVDEPDSSSHESAVLNQEQGLVVGRDRRRGESRKKFEHLLPVDQISAGQFTEYERMDEHLLFFQNGLQLRDSFSQVVDPHRGVDKNHEERRRRGALIRGSLPPRRASRRALSRAMRARSPS